ncbi:MAG: FAD-dependent oxidoreductase [Clostridia bacterium]|nr:FAD-dependent oxidoreductase [Clostridia bacterium]
MKWKCTVCGEVFNHLPEVCPVCGAQKTAFSPYEEQQPSFSKDTDESFVIIGGGIAALQAAKAIRARNKTAAVTLIFSDTKIPYNRPALSDVLSGELKFSDIVLENYNYYKNNNITLMPRTKAKSIDRAVKKVVFDGGELAYDKLLLATGATAFCPFAVAEDTLPILTVRSFEDSATVSALIDKGSKRVLIAGGGILGIEAAVALNSRGVEVTVVERGTNIVNVQLDAYASGLLSEHLSQNGIKILTQTTVSAFGTDGVRLDNGDFLQSDFMLVSMGVRSNIELAIAAGLPTNRGIIVDDYMRTQDKDIFAAGDCAEYYGRAGGLWIISSAQGKTAGAAMCGDLSPYKTVPFATAFEGLGKSFFSVGSCQNATESAIFEDKQKGIYKKLSFKDGKLDGVILFGDTANSNKAMELVYTADIETAKRLLL